MEKPIRKDGEDPRKFYESLFAWARYAENERRYGKGYNERSEEEREMIREWRRIKCLAEIAAKEMQDELDYIAEIEWLADDRYPLYTHSEALMQMMYEMKLNRNYLDRRYVLLMRDERIRKERKR